MIICVLFVLFLLRFLLLVDYFCIVFRCEYYCYEGEKYVGDKVISLEDKMRYI